MGVSTDRPFLRIFRESCFFFACMVLHAKEKKPRRMSQNATSFVIFANVDLFFRLMGQFPKGDKQGESTKTPVSPFLFAKDAFLPPEWPTPPENSRGESAGMVLSSFFASVGFPARLNGPLHRKNNRGESAESPLRPFLSKTFFLPPKQPAPPGNNQCKSA